MSNLKILAILLVALVVGVVTGKSLAPERVIERAVDKLAGLVHISEEIFVQGLKAGDLNQFTLSNKGVLTTTATTTLDNNLDGGFAEDFITVSATGSAQLVYTNTGGPKWCDGSSGGIYADEVTTTASPLAPSLVFAMGTSTTATGYSVNLMASTTVATTSNMLLTTLSRRFILGPTESIVASISDPADHAMASSTYFGNWKVNFKISCTLLER